ncbi:LacI family transcriptional regulator [Yinghuangia sp. ASG 101]|uniref:LacI family DNA-binding transcriptional regulator n=1 Tax=Yinghuangia sp. ASG 101 TaxID=2896848 RepID=UPI001E53D76D|nr:LacI family DNA-binding transcriptional regulator [Yinghuangia sp. ASG 101]UGQ11554.1 LacI family transcriptional regulator [Yinghuangia sp. ASG 101]
MDAAKRRPTIKDVARHSGVSVATVSYVLNGKESAGVTEETKRRVRAAVTELGYVPNAAGTALRRGHSEIVLLILDPTFVGEASERTVENTVGALSELGHTVVIHTLVSEADAVKVARSLQPRGVVLFAFVTRETHAALGAFGAGRVFGLPAAEGDPAAADRPWERVIGKTQVRYLARRGHERIWYAFPEASARSVVAEHRLRGAREECREQGWPDPRVLTLPLDRERAVATLSAAADVRGGAVCAADDRHALAILAAAADLGWAVPSDVAVIGAEDTVEGRLSVPALTSVRLAASDDTAGFRAWLEAALEGRVTTLMPGETDTLPEVAVRGSA